MYKQMGYFSPPACFLLDKLLRSQPRDIRLCSTFFSVEKKDRMFNPVGFAGAGLDQSSFLYHSSSLWED